MHTTHDSPAESRGRIVSLPRLFAITAAKKGDSFVICVEGELIYPSVLAWSMHCERQRQATPFGSCSILKS